MLAENIAQPAFRAAVTKSPREVEYEVFARVTRGLNAAAKSGDAKETASAVLDNNELWTALYADLADPENALPDKVKAGLISLAIFSIRHGNKVISQSISPEALIDINKNVMKGLRATGEA